MTDTAAPLKLSTPRLRVWLSVDDDEPLRVQTLNMDLVAGERTARKHKWGTMTESPLTMLTFLAWHALRRTKQIPDTLTYEVFEQTCAAVESDDDKPDDDEETNATPTRPGPGSG